MSTEFTTDSNDEINKIEKEGVSWNSNDLIIAGNVCHSGTFTFCASAFETVDVKAGNTVTTSGDELSTKK